MIGKLFGSSTIKAVGNIVDELYTSEEEKAAAKLAIKKVEAELKKRQMDINLADAQSKAGGISGAIQRIWRPLIGFGCALAIMFEYVLKPFLMFFLATFHIETLPLPEMDMGTLMPLVMALLGMGAIRSYEKVKGVNIDKK
mgnify:FL=1|jgi:hypothetical protein|tara:strand:- start:11 stop:433 length:423 start_codon:yes stop_codon:yes gene_type:complete